MVDLYSYHHFGYHFFNLISSPNSVYTAFFSGLINFLDLIFMFEFKFRLFTHTAHLVLCWTSVTKLTTFPDLIQLVRLNY